MLDLKVRNFHPMIWADYFFLVNTSFKGPTQGLP